MTNDKLPEEIVRRIDLEARQFAFYNYVTQSLHPNAVFERMDTWPSDARVCYYSILHYMSRPDICWPHKEPTLATEWAQWKVKYDEAKKDFDRVQKSAIHYANRKDEVEKERDELKDQAQRMADALEKILKQQTYYDVIELAANALQQFKDGKGVVRPEHNVSIGEHITYCHACGFPVDECNCIENNNPSK